MRYKFKLSTEQLAFLSEASPIDKGFPHTFLESNHVRNLIFGETFSKIDTHR